MKLDKKYSDLMFDHPQLRSRHNLNRYFKFLEYCLFCNALSEGALYHKHHVLPKAKDFFPEYKSFFVNEWNVVHLTPRQHFIAHRMLHRSFMGSSQTSAFYNMSNIAGKMTSKSYQEAKNIFSEKIKIRNKDKSRCQKISMALKGRPKSAEYRAAMVGHIVSEETRQKLREANIRQKTF